MADNNMCGPSNGAKNLLAHAERDRSLHQDRVVNVPQAGLGNSFRTQAPVSNDAEMAFAAFQQQGPAPIEPTFGPGLDMNVMGPHGASVVRAPMGNIGPSVPAARLTSPATGGATAQEWVNEFNNMQLADRAAMPPPARPMAMAHAMNPAMNPAMRPAMNVQTRFAVPPVLGGIPNNAGMNTVAQQAQTGLANDNAAAAIDNEAFDRAFAEYDQMNFENELAEWEEQQKAADREFEEAQEMWMAEHGPNVKPPTADEMKEIDADLEQLAQEQEAAQQKKRRAATALARAATDIVNSVADNTSDKFQQSRFLALMRRIGAREVVIEGDRFVYAESGEPVTGMDDAEHARLLAIEREYDAKRANRAVNGDGARNGEGIVLEYGPAFGDDKLNATGSAYASSYSGSENGNGADAGNGPVNGNGHSV